MLIDCHVHLNNYHEETRQPTEKHLDDLLAKMNEWHIDHAVVISSYVHNVDRPSAEDLLALIKDEPRLTLVEGLRWRGDDRTDLFGLEERIRDGHVKGIKLYPGYEPYPINDPSLEGVFNIAAKRKVPIMVHTGDTYSKTAKVRHAHPLLVDDVAVDYPDVKFVICHLGNPWFKDAAEVLYKNDNVYADISGLVLGEFKTEFETYIVHQFKEMVHFMGDPGKQLMYGSDWPLVRMGPYVKFLDSLPLEEDQREGVRWKTAATLFKIDLDRLKKFQASNAAPAPEG